MLHGGLGFGDCRGNWGLRGVRRFIDGGSSLEELEFAEIEAEAAA